jgi:arginyl-tRNA synthetase
MLQKIKSELFSCIQDIYPEIKFSISDIEVSSLYDEKGDFTSNLCLKYSKIVQANPSEIANRLIDKFKLEEITRIEVAGPGFLNFFITNSALMDLLNEKPKSFTDTSSVNIEFVSANPTGPLHLAHGRGAVVGDVLSNIYKYFGHRVTREYYVNNTGNQIKEFVSSILFKISEKNKLNLNYPQFYKGEYIQIIADNCYDHFNSLINFKDLKEDDEINIVNFAIKSLVKQSIETLNETGIQFDLISYETDIVNKKLLPEIITKLSEKNLIYKGQLDMPKDYQGTQKDNEITIFKSTFFEDDEDRAITKNDGTPTYFANDIAYHADKHKRGFDKLINIWGADHLGYLKRLSAALKALYPSIDFSVVFCQIVNLKRDNKIQKLSKREGNIFELKLLVEEIGIENFRYFMCYRKNDTHMDLDIDLIKKENKENPIYYIQYSYARAQSVLDRKKNIINTSIDMPLELKNLYKKLYDWDSVALSAYKKQEVHLIAHYLESLASYFHSLWSSAKSNSQIRFLDNDNNLSNHSYNLLKKYQDTLNEGLNILGIKPKLKM